MTTVNVTIISERREHNLIFLVKLTNFVTQIMTWRHPHLPPAYHRQSVHGSKLFLNGSISTTTSLPKTMI